MAGGRPLKFKSVQELQEKIDAYFESVKEPRAIGGAIYFEPITITGLALALGCHRETLLNYEDKDEFFDTIKTAKTRVEHYAERQLYMGKSATGSIFALKNFGWKDTQDMNMGGQKDNPIVHTLADSDKAALEHYIKTRGTKDA